MRPTRVISITYDYYPFDVRVSRLAQAAVDAGIQMEVICVRGDHEPPMETHNGVLIHRMPMSRLFGNALVYRIADWVRFMALAGAAVARLHHERPYDVVHVHNMPDFLVFSALMPKLKGARVILDVQDTTPELMASKLHGWKRQVGWHLAALQERVSTAFADHVVTVGWPFEELLLQRGVAASKMTSVINSADATLFPRERMTPPYSGNPTSERPLILMYYGTLAERKGLDIALRALALARREVPHVRLHIMGRGEELPALKQLTGDLEIEEAVQFFPAYPPGSDEIIDFIKRGDIGIIPSRCNGFEELVLPTKAYEMAWLHRPIIAADTVAITSMFRPSSLALCRPSDPGSFADAIVELYRDPARRLRMTEDAAADYEQYRWERARVPYQELLFSLAHRSSSNSVRRWLSALQSLRRACDRRHGPQKLRLAHTHAASQRAAVAPCSEDHPIEMRAPFSPSTSSHVEQYRSADSAPTWREAHAKRDGRAEAASTGTIGCQSIEAKGER